MSRDVGDKGSRRKSYRSNNSRARHGFGAPVDEPSIFDRKIEQKQILENRERGKQTEMLMDERDAMLAQCVRPDGQSYAPAVDDDGGFAIGVMEARKNLDEGRLAGTVLTKKAVDFAVTDSQTDVVERFDAAEALGEPINPQNVGSDRLADPVTVGALAQLPQLAISVDIGVAVACIHLRRLAGGVRVVLVEDQERVSSGP